MFLRRHLVPAAVLASTVAVLSGCVPDASPKATATSEPSPTASAPKAHTAGSSADRPTLDQDDGDEVHLNPEAEYSDFETDRQLTTLEKALMRKPGPYSGDEYDRDAVVDAVVAAQPSTAREWAEAVLTEIHPDYAEAAQDVITFEARIEGVPDEPVEKAAGDVRAVGANHFAIVLDASGSMAEGSGPSTRMAEAKEAIRSFAAWLPRSSTVSLRVYGQEGSNAAADEHRSCASTQRIYSGGPDRLGASLRKVRPTGWTPLALAVKRSADDIPADASDAIVYVVTDGLETCGGDPVAAARSLSRQGIEPVVNVIGLHVGDAATRRLRGIAKAGRGSYTSVDSQAELRGYWRRDAGRMMAAWRRWRATALETVEREGRENLERADSAARGVSDAADTEWHRARQVLDVLDREMSNQLEPMTLGEARAELWFRHQAISRWALAHRLDNTVEARDVFDTSMHEVYDRGSERWSAYYRRMARR